VKLDDALLKRMDEILAPVAEFDPAKTAANSPKTRP
jgi:hypothetical protein